MIFAGSTIALKGANQEIFFIGKDSHGFNDNGTASGSGGIRTNNTASKLGDSTGSTLTFIDAVFTGSNALVSNDSSKQRIKGDSTTDVEDLKDGNFYASDVHIGQAGERTTYHILFDYTDALGNKAKKGFGKYHTYLGNINGLESDSIIKFKNAGYINEEQIKGTKATILLDNTQLKGDFRADVAVLDFRDNSPAISGNILTSDTKSSGAVLSRKLLTFDLIKSDKSLNFQGAIQAGYKIAPEYNQDGQSILTFQNAPTLNLGAKAATQASEGELNKSSFIQALANDAGFSGIKNAKTEANGFGTTSGSDSSDNKQAYILSGTRLAFEGTNITANESNKAIKEDLYELDLRFDNRDSGRGEIGLGETLGKSTLIANSITMGEAKTNSGSTAQGGRDVSSSEAKNPLGLSLTFHDAGSLVGATKDGISNVIEVKLKDNASFNGVDKIYGTLKGYGEMNVTLSGEALFESSTMSSEYTWAKPDETYKDAQVLIDGSSATKSDITLAHTSGNV